MASIYAHNHLLQGDSSVTTLVFVGSKNQKKRNENSYIQLFVIAEKEELDSEIPKKTLVELEAGEKASLTRLEQQIKGLERQIRIQHEEFGTVIHQVLDEIKTLKQKYPGM